MLSSPAGDFGVTASAAAAVSCIYFFTFHSHHHLNLLTGLLTGFSGHFPPLSKNSIYTVNNLQFQMLAWRCLQQNSDGMCAGERV